MIALKLKILSIAYNSLIVACIIRWSDLRLDEMGTDGRRITHLRVFRFCSYSILWVSGKFSQDVATVFFPSVVGVGFGLPHCAELGRFRLSAQSSCRHEMNGAGMQKGLFFKSFEFIEKVSATKSTEETSAALAGLAENYGCSSYILASFDRPGTLDDPYVLSSGWDPEWSDRYFGNSYVNDDPVVARALYSPEPFVWSETRNDPGTNARGRQILDEAAAFRMSDGVFIPVHGPGGLSGSLALGSEDLEISPEDRKELLLAGFYGKGFSSPTEIPKSPDTAAYSALGQ
jgi:hypothetical protein